VDVTDAIAYTNHDLDDGLKSGILTRDQLEDLTFWNEAVNAVRDEMNTQRGERERSQVIRYLINTMVTDLIQTTRNRLCNHEIDSVEGVRNSHERLVRFSDPVQTKKKELEEALFNRMYNHHRVIRMQERAKRIVRELYDEYMRCPRLLPESFQNWVKNVGKGRAVADYIAGMTDRYAIQEHQELFGKGP